VQEIARRPWVTFAAACGNFIAGNRTFIAGYGIFRNGGELNPKGIKANGIKKPQKTREIEVYFRIFCIFLCFCQGKNALVNEIVSKSFSPATPGPLCA
jgi:hypothetical protein